MSTPSPEFARPKQHTSAFNFRQVHRPQPPLPDSPTKFNNQAPPTTKSNTTHSTCKLRWTSIYVYICTLMPNTWRKTSVYTSQSTSQPTFPPLLRSNQAAPPPPPTRNAHFCSQLPSVLREPDPALLSPRRPSPPISSY